MTPNPLPDDTLARIKELLAKAMDDFEHLVNILEGKAEQEWNYDYLSMRVRDARASIDALISRLEAAEAERDALRVLLEWLDHKGGLGLDVHDRIRVALTANPKDTEGENQS